MDKFELVKSLVLEQVSLNIQPENSCFLYQFKNAGIGIKQLTKWFEGKTIDIYEFNGRFGKVNTCPWCSKKEIDEDHISEHNKTIHDIETIKLTTQAYSLLLKYTRTRNYDALLFLVNRSCQFCIKPGSKDRVGKCELPESARNKVKSLKILGLKAKGFNINDYTDNSVALIYREK